MDPTSFIIGLILFIAIVGTAIRLGRVNNKLDIIISIMEKTARENKIIVDCPHCSKKVKISILRRGEKITCPSCQKKFVG
jgi:DNA-directed RNA polymerase subunit RPC12/RpoP